MLKKMPPYQIIGWAASLILVALVFYYFQLRGGAVGGFGLGLMGVLSCTVLLMFALEVYQLVSGYQRGELFPMRNATFFVVCFSVVALPVLGVYGAVTGQTLPVSTLVLIPVFLFMAARNLFRVTINSVALEAKTGFRAPTYVPLFDVQRVEENETGLVIRTASGPDIRLLRAFFFGSVWNRLRERLGRL